MDRDSTSYRADHLSFVCILRRKFRDYCRSRQHRQNNQRKETARVSQKLSRKKLGRLQEAQHYQLLPDERSQRFDALAQLERRELSILFRDHLSGCSLASRHQYLVLHSHLVASRAELASYLLDVLLA